MAKLNLQQNCINRAGTSSDGVTHGWVAVRCEHCQIVIQRLHHEAVKFKVGTLIFGIMGGKPDELVETLARSVLNHVYWR